MSGHYHKLIMALIICKSNKKSQVFAPHTQFCFNNSSPTQVVVVIILATDALLAVSLHQVRTGVQSGDT